MINPVYEELTYDREPTEASAYSLYNILGKIKEKDIVKTLVS